MILLNTDYPNMHNIMNRMDPDGGVSDCALTFQETNEMLDDIYWKEANLPDSHKETAQSAEVHGSWPGYNQGSDTVKGETNQFTDVMGHLSARSEIDIRLARFNGNSAEWRRSEESIIEAGLQNDFTDALIYNDLVHNPNAFLGFAPRYSTLNTANVVDAGGTGSSLTSIYMVLWGPRATFCIYPKGSPCGLIVKDLGEVDAKDKDGKTFRAYATTFDQDAGLVVKDWRSIVRIANIPKNPTALAEMMARALVRLRPMANGHAAIYMNSALFGEVQVAAMNKSNVVYGTQEIFGKKCTTFRDNIPIRMCDRILYTEDHVN